MHPERCSKSSAMNTTLPRHRIGLFLLVLLNVSALVSIRNLPVMAEYGADIVAYVSIAALVFFIPTALVSAELSTTWPKLGGVYDWVGRAFGSPWGFLAGWLLWVQNIIWFPAMLVFVSATLAYVGDPALAQNVYYTLAVVLIGIWTTTAVNLFGMHFSGWVSAIGLALGTLMPLLLILFIAGETHSLLSPDHASIVPPTPEVPTTLRLQLGYVIAIILAFSGIELSAVHAEDIRAPQRTFPSAILMSAMVVVAVYILGALAVAALVPRDVLGLTEGLMQAFSYGFELTGRSAFTPVVAALVAIGALAMINTWTAGPVKTLLASASRGEIPAYFKKTNHHGAPYRLLIGQAILASAVSLALLFVPTVSASFWILTVLTGMLYCLMYILMFAAGFVLRLREGHTHRPFSVPGGIIGMAFVCGLGILVCVSVIISGFIPPTKVTQSGFPGYVITLAVGLLLTVGSPFLLLKWRQKDTARKTEL